MECDKCKKKIKWYSTPYSKIVIHKDEQIEIILCNICTKEINKIAYLKSIKKYNTAKQNYLKQKGWNK